MESSSMENFIEQVKKYPCLWNPDHISYRDAGRKSTAWNIIALKCGMTNGRDAKFQWKRIRDSHREAIRRRTPTSGQPHVIMRPWKYEHLMEFLLNHTEKKEYTADTQNGINDSTNIDSPGEEESLEAEISQKERCEARNVVPEVNMLGNDALYNLFTSMYMKTRDLPKALQLRVQREVFDSVTRAEEEALNMNQGIGPSSSNDAMQECFVFDNVQVKQESD